MKTRFGFLIMALAMLLCFTTSCSDDLVDYDVFCTISGTVVDLDSGQPIPSATVTLTPSGFNAYTDDNGQFEFVDLNESKYTVTVQKTGFVTDRKTVTTIAGGVVNISITLQKKN